MGELDGRVAIVTGAAGNIGPGTATALAVAGARVVVTDIAEDRLHDVANSLRDAGHDVHAVVGDVTVEADVARVVDATVRRYGGVDILDNNAGGEVATNDGGVASMSTETWDLLMAVNLRGPMLFCKHVIPTMVERGGGSIVNISSGTAFAGGAGLTAYGCAKGGLHTLTRYVATQHGADGIRCNALVLGLVGTEDGEYPHALPYPMSTFLRHHLVGRIGRPSDVANMVAFLASDRSAFITGQVIPVDGGFFAHVPVFAVEPDAGADDAPR